MQTNFLLLTNPYSKQASTCLSFSPEIAIITGADGHLGRAFCTLLPKNAPDLNAYVLVGKQILANYTKDANWQSELEQLFQKQPNIKVFLLLDLDFANSEAISTLWTVLEQELGSNLQVKWLINNAGLGFKGPLACQALDASKTCLSVNVLFPTLCINFLLEAKRFSKKQAYIINIASSSAFAPQANFAVYSATKSYLFYLSQALRAEWQANKQPINCTVACPGPMQSAFLDVANKFVQAQSSKHLVWYKNWALEDAKVVASQAIKAVLANKAVSYSKPLTYLFRSLTKLLPSSLFAYLTSQNKA